MSALETQFIAGSSSLPRADDDFYRTPDHATLALLERESFPGLVWEPACGDGAISKVLLFNAGCGLYSTDLVHRGYGVGGVDFLKQEDRFCNHIVTNPPYCLAEEFVRHALTRVDEVGKVAMLLKLNFLEGQKRKKLFAETPLRTVYVFSKRLSFDRGDVKGKGNGLLAYAWFVWDRSHDFHPELKWI